MARGTTGAVVNLCLPWYRDKRLPRHPKIPRKHRGSLSKRKDKGGWYELQASVDEIERYARLKLVCPNLYNTQTFAVETEGISVALHVTSFLPMKLGCAVCSIPALWSGSMRKSPNS